MDITLVAPASRGLQENLKRLPRFLKSHFPHSSILLPKGLYGDHVFCANEDEKRFQGIQQGLTSESDILWAIRGGYGSQRLLPYLKNLKPSQRKKQAWLIGYSDVTALHTYFNDYWGWPSLHFSGVEELYGKEKRRSADLTRVKNFFLKGEIWSEVLLKRFSWRKKNASISGVLAGGNLSVFMGLMGTSFAPQIKGKVLFFEDCNERGYKVDRLLSQLFLHPHFSQIRAVIFGEFIGGDEPVGRKNLVHHALEAFALKAPFPVYYGFPAGHGKKQHPLILGSKVRIKNEDHKKAYFEQLRLKKEWDLARR